MNMHVSTLQAGALTLEATFWATARALVESRKDAAGNPRVFSAFDEKIAKCIFDAGKRAIEDSHERRKRYNVVSAPTGSGKSSFSWALIAALIKSVEGSSAVFLCETVDQVEDTYKELYELLGDDVVRWHAERRSIMKAEELEQHRVIIVTHSFYKDRNGHLAFSYRGDRRTLTVIDEQPKEVTVYDIDEGDIVKARDWAVQEIGLDSDAHRALEDLLEFSKAAWAVRRPSEKRNFKPLSTSTLSWFNGDAAMQIMNRKVEPVYAVIGFAQSLSTGCSFMSRFEGRTQGGRFVGYRMEMPIRAGSVLLDATADIDGISLIANWREAVETPQLDYRNLTIVSVTPETKARIKNLVKDPTAGEAYIEWMKKVVIENTEVGEKVLLVTHKAFFEYRWLPVGKDSFDDAHDIEGRKVALLHWGTGIGSNRWKDATTVCLIGEFFIPRRAHIAHIFGYLNEPAGGEVLEGVQYANSKYELLKAIEDGHLMRWLKQVGMRGNARNIVDGVCGKQKLVITGDFDRFIRNKETLFPGARLDVDKSKVDTSGKLIGAAALVAMLRTATVAEITSKMVLALTGIDMGKNGKRLLSDQTLMAVMMDLGWRWVPGKGGSRLSPSAFRR